MSDNKIQLKIATPERLVLEELVDQVSLPTKNGEVTILPNHIPLIAELEFGELLAKKGDEDMPFAIWGGLVEVNDNTVVVLSDIAEFAEEISLEKVEQAKQKAEDLMQKKGQFSEQEFADLLYSYQKHTALLKVGKKFQTKKYRKLANIKNNFKN